MKSPQPTTTPIQRLSAATMAECAKASRIGQELSEEELIAQAEAGEYFHWLQMRDEEQKKEEGNLEGQQHGWR